MNKINIETILKNNIGKTLFYIESLDKYIGYINLSNFKYNFTPIGINRLINEDVIKKRVEENLNRYIVENKYYDFGNAELIVIRELKDNNFYIIDGQHRLKTMEKLRSLHSDRDLFIGVSIYVKNTINEAVEYLKHFQNQYPSDNRLFSANIEQRTQLEKILSIFRYLYPNVFIHYDNHISKLINKIDKYYKDPNRPYLSEGLIADFLKNSELKINKLSDINITIEEVKEINNKIKNNLNVYKGQVNHKLIEELNNCYFGIIRKDCKKLLDVINN